jgi:hypothetical protein
MASIALEIAVQPPSVVRLGATLNPPLAVTMSSTTTMNGYSCDLSRVWAFATLIDDYGEVIKDDLTGTLAESAQGIGHGDDSTGYFLFDNLSIERVGSFRIRVTVMRMDNSAAGAASVQQVESDLIVVEDREVGRVSPSIAPTRKSTNCAADFVIGASEQRFLDSLAN